MLLFNFWPFGNKGGDGDNGDGNGPDVPKEVFIDDSDPEPQKQTCSMYLLDEFMETEFERNGYEDALRNDDLEAMKLTIRIIEKDFNITLSKAIDQQERCIERIKMHLRTRQGDYLVNLVERIEAKLRHEEKTLANMETIRAGSNKSRDYLGLAILEYEKGFYEGLAEITKSELGDL